MSNIIYIQLYLYLYMCIYLYMCVCVCEWPDESMTCLCPVQRCHAVHCLI